MVIHLKGKQFKHLLKVGYAVSKDDTKPILMNIHFYLKGGKLYSEAVDGYRLAKASVTYLYHNELDILVNGADLKATNKYIKPNSDIALDIDEAKGTVVVCVDDCVFKCRLFSQGTFINVDSLIDNTKNNYDAIYCVIDRPTLLRELRAIKKTLNTTKSVKLNIVFHRTLDKITLVVEHKDKEYKKTIDCKLSNMSDPITFNLKYFIDTLNSFDDKEVGLMFTNFVSPLLVQNKDVLGFLLPIRTDMNRREYLNNKVNTREAYYASLKTN